MTIYIINLVALVSTLITFSAQALAYEPGIPAEEEHGEGPKLGVHVLFGNASSHGDAHALWGAGIMGEHGILHHRLELTWAGHISRHSLDTEFTETLSLRLPWHMATHTDLFVGAGGMMRQHSEGEFFGAGVFAEAGALYWLDATHHWGLALELELVEDLLHTTHKVEGLAGVLYRFGKDKRHYHETITSGAE